MGENQDGGKIQDSNPSLMLRNWPKGNIEVSSQLNFVPSYLVVQPTKPLI